MGIVQSIFNECGIFTHRNNDEYSRMGQRRRFSGVGTYDNIDQTKLDTDSEDTDDPSAIEIDLNFPDNINEWGTEMREWDDEDVVI